jgi:hypothetical protein
VFGVNRIPNDWKLLFMSLSPQSSIVERLGVLTAVAMYFNLYGLFRRKNKDKVFAGRSTGISSIPDSSIMATKWCQI